MKIKDILEKNNNDLIIALTYLLNTNKNLLFLNKEEALDEKIENELKIINDKINEGYPLQYAIGKWNFYGLDLLVDKRALIPRYETEILVDLIINDNSNNKKILDIGTGSGAISLALSKNLKDSKIIGVDISKNAIDLANENKIKLNINNVEFKESDIFSNIDEKFDIIVSNPPYINKEDFEKLDNKLYYEPQNALYGGEDGLYFYKKIIKNAKNFLNKNGKIYLEIGYDQKDSISNLLEEYGYKQIKSYKDFNDFDRIIKACI
ncbi:MULTISPECIES: peptide chain release factor N(5)-glutamine methyltransferase [Anaerococcus]|uniref:peptide chain release factor N(5)-glutamine methyltransferase n=1 Tax=Anaerococcus TaxID=165779 RepID=UPI0008A5400D|nr:MULTISPECIES: peptide chain release factor N(5)-glutamine methyltransferase [Anaerococcus]MBS4889198.1 peptide chain release factor N(5)-glutamine methyltransferase [Anaerococcus vaginalis]MDU5342391.1 peptide chain release factor N(5)-glutamine methyltransferase [Anaerococcus vaginalis]OFO41967.1 protein-(glutamine-N5) methyltransferase, release factor-specific [Anaerococcus sp. HMSC075B03]